MTLYCAIDLHSNNNVPVVIDDNDKILFSKRLQLVRHRVTHMLSAQNQLWRTTGENITIKLIKKADYSLLSLFENRYLKMAFKANLDVINLLSRRMREPDSGFQRTPGCVRSRTWRRLIRLALPLYPSISKFLRRRC